MCKSKLQNVFVHAFTDGRDTDPKSAILFLKDLEDHMKVSVGRIALFVAVIMQWTGISVGKV